MTTSVTLQTYVEFINKSYQATMFFPEKGTKGCVILRESQSVCLVSVILLICHARCIWVSLLPLIQLSVLSCLAVHQEVQHRLACHQLQIWDLLWWLPNAAKVRKIRKKKNTLTDTKSENVEVKDQSLWKTTSQLWIAKHVQEIYSADMALCWMTTCSESLFLCINTALILQGSARFPSTTQQVQARCSEFIC